MVYITFGSNHLKGVKVYPMEVLLEVNNREEVFASFIGDKFCTSYTEEEAMKIKRKFGMVIYTLEELIERRIV